MILDGEDKMKKFKVFITILVILAVGSSMAYAGTSYKSYSTTVGKLNGNGYTAYQTKAKTGANGTLVSSSVGGKYTVDARMQDKNGIIGPWTRDVDDNKTYTLKGHANHIKGYGIRVHFSNDLTTTVDIQVEGKWKSN